MKSLLLVIIKFSYFSKNPKDIHSNVSSWFHHIQQLLRLAESLAHERVSGRYSIRICKINEYTCLSNLYSFFKDSPSLVHSLSFL